MVAGNRWFGRLHVIVVLMLIGSGLAVLGGLLTTVVLALQSGRHVDYGFPGLWPAQDKVDLEQGLTPGTQVVRTMVELTAFNAGDRPALTALFVLTWLPTTLTAFLALFWLSRITLPGGFGDNVLFSVRTVTLLRRIGKVLVIGSLAAVALDFAAKTAAAHILLQGAYAIPGTIVSPFFALAAGTGAYVVAEVIRRGLEMLDDLQGTI
ncbi:DUF2975 domain-containing protein [Sphaerisporangium corydalis]|uniref:DUF2975 domain-containing protein n=1 Tax=Sphaerisporangium corydalis TaxID=1441875 RepID=A0ABV9E7K6_9ACTN|nr:DUF2975 domain-containing protein [Sphaerisporangium corydalis]